MSIELLPIEPEEVKLGMHVHSVEWYEHGAMIQFRGVVCCVGRDEEGRRFAQLRGIPYTGITGRHPWRVDLFEVVGVAP